MAMQHKASVQMAIILLFIALTISIIFLLAVRNKSRRCNRHPPGPKGLPLIGNLHQIDVSKPHIWFANQSNKYGPITFFKFCRLPVVVLSSAEVAKNVCKNHDVTFAGRPSSSAWFKLSYSMRDISGSPCTDYWRQMRKIVVHHLFSPQKIRSFRPIREEEVLRMVAEISDKARLGEFIDVDEMALSFTWNTFCRVAFGKKFDEGSASWRLYDKIMNQFLVSLSETFFYENLLFGWITKLSGADRRVDKVFKYLDSFYQELIDAHLSSNKADSMGNDLLDLLIQLREDESASLKIDWEHIKGILMNMLLGGVDTAGVTITWALTSLMKKPTTMKKAQEEIRNAIGLKSFVDEDDIEKLPFLKAVVKETLRLYPPIPLGPRESTAMSTINGYEIQPKTVVFINLWAIGRDPECWENPEEFLPERFLNKTTNSKEQDFGFIPFGFGRRICPGYNLGVAMVELALANILCFFNWELPPGMKEEDVETEPAIGLVIHKKKPLCLLPRMK